MDSTYSQTRFLFRHSHFPHSQLPPPNRYYDELAFALGTPLGDAYNADTSGTGPVQSFPLTEKNFALWVGDGSAAVSFTNDVALVNVTRNAASISDVDLFTNTLALKNSSFYRLNFTARANTAAMSLGVNSRHSGGSWTSYGLAATVTVNTSWTTHSIAFKSLGTDAAARLSFWIGAAVACYEIANVTVSPGAAPVFIREYQHGTAIVNGDDVPHNVTLPAHRLHRRLSGAQAPRWQYIVDDASSAFSAPLWRQRYIEGGYDFSDPTAEKIPGPYFHQWWSSCAEGGVADMPAAWDLSIPEPGEFNISVWWAAYPSATSLLSRQARYVLRTITGKIAGNVSLSQADEGGDVWTLLFSNVNLTPGTVLSLACEDSTGRVCVADAVLVESMARYNDGSDLQSGVVTVGALDGVLLDARN